MMSMTKAEQKSVKSLASKKGRKDSGMFVAEGVRLLEESFRHRYFPEKVYYAEHLLSDRGRQLLGRLSARRITTEAVSAQLLRAIATATTPQGIVAVFKTPTANPAELSRGDYRKILLCENISDPGNLGTLARSAIAFDFRLMLLTGNSAEPFAPKVVQSSAGAVFGLIIARMELDEIIAFIGQRKIAVVAADVQARDDRIPAGLQKRPFMLAIGSEATGLSQAILRRADMRIRIRHAQTVESLNAAVAGSIIMSRMYHSV
jgi:TrmH family RNA methyltransferase